jgi:DnaK suppressor protein
MKAKAKQDLSLESYKPNEDEQYMNPQMLAYFEKKLIKWKEDLIKQSQSIKNSIEENTERVPDHVDEAIIEETRDAEYFFAERDLNLMVEIDQAIDKD